MGRPRSKAQGFQNRKEVTKMPDISSHKAWFLEYVAQYYEGSTDDIKYIDLKRDHTQRVLENAEHITASLTLDDRTARISLLGALYHDVGRFEQFRQYHTFSDSTSVNHGLLGSRILKHEQPLAGEPQDIQIGVRAAVALHNRFTLPANLPEHITAATNVVRDSDKLDIFPILVSNFIHDGSKNDVVTMGLKDFETNYTPVMLKQVLAGDPVKYSDMEYVNDFKLLLASWAFGIVYPASMQLMHERGVMEKLLATLPELPEMEDVKGAVRAEMKRVLPSVM